MRMVAGALLACTLATACAEFRSVRCEDGRVCPAGTACDSVHRMCVQPSQLAACAGVADGDPCEIGVVMGFCDQEVCIQAFCGDGVARGLEQCDGSDLGNANSCTSLGYYDNVPLTCNFNCQYEVSQCTGYCGDAVVNGPEQCDANATTCQVLGFANGGAVECSKSCTWDTSGCSG